MNAPKYVFDANIFIKMQRLFNRDVFVSLWDSIDTLIKDGIIISSDEVFEEIAASDDELLDWVKDRKSIFVKSDENIQSLVRDILKSFPKLVLNPGKANGADPFIIALSKYKDCSLVTDENRGSIVSPKIPIICEQFGVRCIKFIEFLRENKMRF
jgi:hypothetical protein